MNADGHERIINHSIVQHCRLPGRARRESDSRLPVVMAVVSDQNRGGIALLADTGFFIFKAFVVDDRWRCVSSRADSCQLISVTAVAANDWCRLFSRADSGHIILVAVIILNDGSRGTSRADSNASSAIPVAAVIAHDRPGSLTDSDSSSNIAITLVASDQWAGVIVSNTGLEIFETGIAFYDRRGLLHAAYSAAHVAITHVSRDQRRTAFSLHAFNRNTAVANVVNNVVADDTRHASSADARCSWLSNGFVSLLFTLCFEVSVPFRIVVCSHIGDGEAVECGSFGHRNAWPCSLLTTAVDYCDFSAFQSDFTWLVITSTPDRDTRLQLDSFFVDARSDDNHVSCVCSIDRRLDRSVVIWNMDLACFGYAQSS